MIVQPVPPYPLRDKDTLVRSLEGFSIHLTHKKIKAVYANPYDLNLPFREKNLSGMQQGAPGLVEYELYKAGYLAECYGVITFDFPNTEPWHKTSIPMTYSLMKWFSIFYDKEYWSNCPPELPPEITLEFQDGIVIHRSLFHEHSTPKIKIATDQATKPPNKQPATFNHEREPGYPNSQWKQA